MHTATYPPPRPRARGRGPAIAERFDRYESTGGEITIGDTNSEVLRCSGRADLFILTAKTNGALFTLTDRVGTELDELTVLPGVPERVRIGRSIVLARNLVAGNNAAVSVLAAFATPADSLDGG